MEAKDLQPGYLPIEGAGAAQAPATRENGRVGALVFGLAAAVALFSWWMSLAPAPLPADAPPTEFSAYRAIEHVRQMAVEPHPCGSHAIDKVYDYIAGRLRAMGVETVVDRPIILRGDRTIERIGAVLARIPGTAPTGAFIIDAHFDSTPYGPGASDDLCGIAAMLETARALKASPPLRNDVVFCFADKEEMGGDGGPGVLMRHPWFKDARAVLGLETRGTSGPALMFETGRDNGFLVRQLAQSDAHPRASSMMFDFYGRMPFGSDFDKYKSKDLPGLNVAFINDFANYHTKLDVPENLSLASLQHHGYYALGLARQLGNVSLENCRAPNAIYFNTIGSYMVVYPFTWGKSISIGALCLFGLILVFGLVRRRLTIGGLFAGMGVYLASAVLAFAATAPMAWLTYHQFRELALYRNTSFALSMTMIGVGIVLLLARLVRNRVRPQNLLAGSLVWWAVLVVAFECFAPYGSYAAAWPLAFASLGLLALCFARDRERPSNALLTTTALAAVPAVAILVPGFATSAVSLTSLVSPALLVFVILVVSMFLPQLSLVPKRIHSSAGALLVLAGATVFAVAFLANTPSPDRPRQNCLSYAVNFDTGDAWWISGDAKLDEWTSNFFQEDAPRISLNEFIGGDHGARYRKGIAPAPPFEKFVMRLIDDRTENGRRFLRFFVDSPRDAQEARIRLTSDAPVFRAKAFGIDVEGADKHWDLRLETIPFEGGELEIETEPGKPLQFGIREVSYGLPDIQGFTPRPPYMMTQPNRVLEREHLLPSNHTFSICTYIF